jgi:ribose-phosphate pyrophosphokinase
MLLDKGAISVRAVCTHAVLSGNAFARVAKSGIKEFIVTDTIPMKQDPEIDTSKFTVLSVAETFADVIEKVYKFKSISDTFIF